MDLIEKTIKSNHIYEGKVVDLWVNTVELQDGRETFREIINHPGGVCVLAVDDDGMVYIVRQFRNPAQQVMTEIPAGKLEPGEDVLEAAKRELEEETGICADEMISMGYFYPTPAYCKERIYMYFARGLRKTKQHLDDGEFLEVEKISYDTLYEMVMNGEIIDGKTALAVLKAREYIK